MAVSIIVLYELVYGLNNISDEEQKKGANQGINFIKNYLSVIPLDMKEVEIFAKLKTKYKQSTGINRNAINRHNLDLLIASTAMATNSIIVSNNRIFEKLVEIEPKLKYENWLL